ncbi:hypothetical protein DXC37_08820 [Bifidobacterium bifidum]|uniref:hypothetical protein n=1 Tax=Bifidobacterium bifidum TaxID=1681 RepID=UPI000E43BD5F|nr:hypothetical protein [Bifidobacterium bifidum]RGL95027.1 hypothetical protein DXC37_08820 [Bifidobacterium bifidum]
MSYTDMFGTPLTGNQTGDDRETGNNNESEGHQQPLLFKGFASPLPLLAERPSVYLQRIRDAASSLIEVPGGSPDDRVLFTPAISLPFLILKGDERFPNETVLGYPLLHVPQGHEPDVDTDPNEFALTMVAAYTATGVMREDDGDLLAYEVTDPVDIDPDVWEAAASWAHDTVKPLMTLNQARLLGFAMQHPKEETRPLELLFSTWGETRIPNAIIEDGKKAAEIMEGEYNVFIDRQFKPFLER